VDWVYRNSPTKGAQRAVLLALAWRMRRGNPDAGCWAALQTIADDSGLSRSTAFRALVALEEGGHLAIEHRPGTTGVYRIPALIRAQREHAQPDQAGQSDNGVCSPCDGGVLTVRHEPVSNCERTAQLDGIRLARDQLVKDAIA
jgi:hypothetical protein